MTSQPNQRPLLPVQNCTCAICQQMREDFAAAALMNMIKHAEANFNTGHQNADAGKPEVNATT